MHTDDASVQTLIRLIDERKAEIERLRNNNAKLLEALERITREADPLAANCLPPPHACHACEILFVAREALAEKGQTP